MMEYIFDEIEVCECIGEFEDEYVYDIEMDDETHTFIANDILVHNSLYISYEPLLESIVGYENMTTRQKLEIIVGINEKFLNDHNKKFMDDYYASRHVHSIHEFELETVNLRGIWLDVKKRYAQVLLWKDGKYFDEDSLPLKVKGLEMIKSSYPKFDREALKKTVRALLETDDEQLWFKINQLVQQVKRDHNEAELEDICAAIGVNGYTKYILEQGGQETVIDKDNTVLHTAMKCPANVRALGNYNAIREAHHLPGDPIYGGKVKTYIYKPYPGCKKDQKQPFAFQSRNYPKWAAEYAPIDRDEMFQKYFLDPLNRICKDSMKFKPFKLDGSMEYDLFDFL